MARVFSRKKILITVVALLGVFLLSMLMGCSRTEPQFDLVKNYVEYGDKVFENMQYLAETYSDRTMSTQGELDTAKYLAKKLSDFGYESDYSYEDTVGLQHFRADFTRYDGSAVSDPNGYNVIFTKKAKESNGEIILSAQYDNLYEEKTGGEMWKADGSYESGSGCATLLALAEIMSAEEYSYDITFAFLTGGCYGWEGANQFAAQLKNSDIENIRFNINFSMLGGGDNLYLYTGENVTVFGGYIRSASYGLTPNPKDKNVAPFAINSEYSSYLFSHIGMVGNQYFLMNRNVPIANYTSHNWSCNDNPFFTEMKGNANVYHTADDTLAKMVERKGEENIKAMLSDVVNSVLTAISEDNAVIRESVLATANEPLAISGQSSKASSMASIAIKLIAVAVFFCIALTVRNYVKRNRKLYVKEQPVEKEEIKPFDFDTYPKSGESRKDQDDDFDDDNDKNQPYDPFV